MIAFILSNWRFVAIGAFVFVCAASVGVSRWQVHSVKSELAEYKAAYTILADAAKQCTASITALEDSEKESSKKVAIATKKAKEAATSLKAQGSLLAHMTKPAVIGDCDATNDLVNSAIRGGL